MSIHSNDASGASQGRSNLVSSVWRWLQPGLGVKRWLVLTILGTSIIGLGLAIILLDLYRANPESSLLSLLSLRELPRWLRGALLISAGISLTIYSILRLNRVLLEPYIRPGRPVVEDVARHRRLRRGPRIVALGGGTGQSTLLRGLKERSSNLTAIVTVADDGGSSGRLRKSLGLPPPGDIRSCLAALSDDEDLLTQLFQYRFSKGQELDGHSFGNLFIAALAGVTGSFDRGVQETGRVLRVRGQVLPSTLIDVELVAQKSQRLSLRIIEVEGESQIPDVPGSIQRVELRPGSPPAYPEAIRSILNAEMIVIGPGSLYTSVLPNLLVPDIGEAVHSSRAFRVFVSNVATQAGETDQYTCEQHLEAIDRHVGKGIVDLVVANDNLSMNLPGNTEWVAPPNGRSFSTPFYLTDLVDEKMPWRHDPEKLANALFALLEERTGPLELPPLEELEPSSGLN